MSPFKLKCCGFLLVVFFMPNAGAQNTWSQGANLKAARATHAVATVNGKIYAIGGVWAQDDTSVEEYDPESDTWTTVADLPVIRDFLSCAVVNEKVYVCGGFAGFATFNKLNVFDPATDSWTTKSGMPTSRWGHAACTVNGLIYVMGGARSWPVSKMYETIEVYNPETDKWTTKSSLLTPRWKLSCSVVNGKIYAIGGYDEDNQVSLSTVEEYDPETDTWTTKSSMPNARYGIATVVVNNKIYAIGGAEFYPIVFPYDIVAEYDPVTDIWTTKSSMPAGRTWIAASSLNGKIYVPGGGNLVEGDNNPELYIYDTGYETGIENRINKPDNFHLHQNYPNPFNLSTTIRYSLPGSDFVTLKIYNLLNQEVEIVVNAMQPAGDHQITWTAEEFTGGVYFYKLQTGVFSETKKLILQK